MIQVWKHIVSSKIRKKQQKSRNFNENLTQQQLVKPAPDFTKKKKKKTVLYVGWSSDI